MYCTTPTVKSTCHIAHQQFNCHSSVYLSPISSITIPLQCTCHPSAMFCRPSVPPISLHCRPSALLLSPVSAHQCTLRPSVHLSPISSVTDAHQCTCRQSAVHLSPIKSVPVAHHCTCPHQCPSAVHLSHIAHQCHHQQYTRHQQITHHTAVYLSQCHQSQPYPKKFTLVRRRFKSSV